MELEFLVNMKFSLYVNEQDWKNWSHKFSKLAKIARSMSALAASQLPTTHSLSPLPSTPHTNSLGQYASRNFAQQTNSTLHPNVGYSLGKRIRDDEDFPDHGSYKRRSLYSSPGPLLPPLDSSSNNLLSVQVSPSLRLPIHSAVSASSPTFIVPSPNQSPIHPYPVSASSRLQAPTTPISPCPLSFAPMISAPPRSSQPPMAFTSAPHLQSAPASAIV